MNRLAALHRELRARGGAFLRLRSPRLLMKFTLTEQAMQAPSHIARGQLSQALLRN